MLDYYIDYIKYNLGICRVELILVMFKSIIL